MAKRREDRLHWIRHQCRRRIFPEGMLGRIAEANLYRLRNKPFLGNRHWLRFRRHHQLAGRLARLTLCGTHLGARRIRFEPQRLHRRDGRLRRHPTRHRRHHARASCERKSHDRRRSSGDEFEPWHNPSQIAHRCNLRAALPDKKDPAVGRGQDVGEPHEVRWQWLQTALPLPALSFAQRGLWLSPILSSLLN